MPWIGLSVLKPLICWFSGNSISSKLISAPTNLNWDIASLSHKLAKSNIIKWVRSKEKEEKVYESTRIDKSTCILQLGQSWIGLVQNCVMYLVDDICCCSYCSNWIDERYKIWYISNSKKIKEEPTMIRERKERKDEGRWRRKDTEQLYYLEGSFWRGNSTGLWLILLVTLRRGKSNGWFPQLLLLQNYQFLLSLDEEYTENERPRGIPSNKRCRWIFREIWLLSWKTNE